MSIYPWSTPLSTSGFLFFQAGTQAIANELTWGPAPIKKLVLESVLHQGFSKLTCQIFKLDANSTNYPVILAIWVTAHCVAQVVVEYGFPTHPLPTVLDGYVGRQDDEQALIEHARRRSRTIDYEEIPRECHKISWNVILHTSFVSWLITRCFYEMHSNFIKP